jgi:hypothetical protein
MGVLLNRIKGSKGELTVQSKNKVYPPTKHKRQEPIYHATKDHHRVLGTLKLNPGEQ